MRQLKLAAICFVSFMAAFAFGAAIKFAVIFSEYPEVWPWPNAIDIAAMASVSLILFIVALLWLKRLI